MPDATHIDDLLNDGISQLIPYSALILTILAVVVFVFRLYFIEKFLMNTKMYRFRYHSLSDNQKRSLVNHHVAGTCKVILLVVGVYPFLSIAFGKTTLHTPWAAGSIVTLGDTLLMCSHFFTVMYIFELFYRANLSPITAAHHVGAVVIGQAAVAMNVFPGQEQDAVMEFIMCFLWGVFDVLAELWPHVAMILYRVLPPSQEDPMRKLEYHALMSRIFTSVAVMEVCGTATETVIALWLFGSLWDEWTLPFKAVTPILHVLFSCAQLWGAWVFWSLAKREKNEADAIVEIMPGIDRYGQALPVFEAPLEVERRNKSLVPNAVMTEV